mmetsp:Transcript_5074/g.20838  ORF Transcript_5074/g.20838 Transcript_5074/m.20838 type:complete len:239 (+) Transcript_5074:164-880(+)
MRSGALFWASCEQQQQQPGVCLFCLFLGSIHRAGLGANEGTAPGRGRRRPRKRRCRKINDAPGKQRTNGHLRAAPRGREVSFSRRYTRDGEDAGPQEGGPMLSQATRTREQEWRDKGRKHDKKHTRSYSTATSTATAGAATTPTKPCSRFAAGSSSSSSPPTSPEQQPKGSLRGARTCVSSEGSSKSATSKASREQSASSKKSSRLPSSSSSDRGTRDRDTPCQRVRSPSHDDSAARA